MIRFIFVLLVVSYVHGSLILNEEEQSRHKIEPIKPGAKRVNHQKHSRKAAIKSAMVELYGSVECIWHDEELCQRVLDDQLVATYLHIGTVNKGINQEFWLDDAILAIEEEYCRECDHHPLDQCTCEYIHGLAFNMTNICPPPSFQIGHMCYSFATPELHICHYDVGSSTMAQAAGTNSGTCSFECMEPCIPQLLAGSVSAVSCAFVQNTISTCGSACSDKQAALWISFTGCTCEVLPSAAACADKLECVWDSTTQMCILAV